MKAYPLLGLAALCLLIAGCVVSAQESRRQFVPVVFTSYAEGGVVRLAPAALVLVPADVRQITGTAAYQDLTATGAVDESSLTARCPGPAEARAQLRSLGWLGAHRSVLRTDAAFAPLEAAHIVAAFTSGGGAQTALATVETCSGSGWSPIGVEPIGDESRAWRGTPTDGGATPYLLVFRTASALHRLEVTIASGDALDTTLRLAELAVRRAIPVTPTPFGTATATPTVTSTPSATATPTPTPPSGAEIAAGKEASASDFSPGHGPADAVDPRASGPAGQEPATYWLARGQASPSNVRSWSVNLGTAENVAGIQARLYLGGPGTVTVQARLLDASANLLAAPVLLSGAAADGQVVGVTFATPVAGTRQVFLIFSESPAGVAPGLRTVGVYAGP